MQPQINARSTILDRIMRSELSATTIRNAIRLLEVAHPDNGYVCLPEYRIRELLSVTNTGTVRRHLGTLQAAGLIHYSTDRFEHFHIAFLLWPGTGITLATVATPEQ